MSMGGGLLSPVCTYLFIWCSTTVGCRIREGWWLWFIGILVHLQASHPDSSCVRNWNACTLHCANRTDCGSVAPILCFGLLCIIHLRAGFLNLVWLYAIQGCKGALDGTADWLCWRTHSAPTLPMLCTIPVYDNDASINRVAWWPCCTVLATPAFQVSKGEEYIPLSIIPIGQIHPVHSTMRTMCWLYTFPPFTVTSGMWSEDIGKFPG